MRLLLLPCLIALICLTITSSHAQQSNPTWLDSTSFESTTAASRTGPLAKLFSWFRRPIADQQPMAAPLVSQQNDRLAKMDFTNSLPKENTDRMISDAITDRILEESRSQQVIVGSPFIEEQTMSADHDASASEQDIAVAFPRGGYSKSLANTPTESLPLTEALRIVHSSNLDDCVARVICELSCNANSYGVPGRGVFRNLIKLQFDQNVKSDDAKFFRQAAAKGRQIVQGKRDCNECFTIYPTCNASSEDLVAVSSMFKL